MRCIRPEASPPPARSWTVVLRLDGYTGRHTVRVRAGDMQAASEIAARDLVGNASAYITSTGAPRVVVESVTESS